MTTYEVNHRHNWLRYAISLGLVSLAFGIGGLIFGITIFPNVTPGSKIQLILMMAVAGLLIPFGILYSWLALWESIRRRPAFVIYESGVDVSPMGVPTVFIKWERVMCFYTAITVTNKHAHQTIGILPLTEADYLGELKGLGRFLARMNEWFYPSMISFGTFYLDSSVDEIKEAVGDRALFFDKFPDPDEQRMAVLNRRQTGSLP